MKHIDEILIRHGMDPTVVDLSDKERLNEWLSALDRDEILSFQLFPDQIQSHIKSRLIAQNAQTEQLLGLLKNATAAIEPLLTDYPERAVTFRNQVEPTLLVRLHATMLADVENVKNQAEQFSELLTSLDSNSNAEYLKEMALRHVALSAFEKHRSLACRYQALSAQAAASLEWLERAKKHLTDNRIALHAVLSELAASASSTLTAANRQKLPQADYFKILRQTLINLHTITQATKQIQKEAPLCQNI